MKTHKNSYEILIGMGAAKFAYVAVREHEEVLLNGFDIKKTECLKIKCGGYWEDNVGYLAFDNYSNAITIERFADKSEAIKYAKGELAVTIIGEEI
jgi:hypothetical protein